jgi:hypothetical protein
LVFAVDDVFAQVFDGVSVFTAFDHAVDEEGQLFTVLAGYGLQWTVYRTYAAGK